MKPKLTKAERFILTYLNCRVEYHPSCKYKYIARDKNGALNLFSHEPYLHPDYKVWCVLKGYIAALPLKNNFFKFIKWDDKEPWKIDDLLKLEVEE